MKGIKMKKLSELLKSEKGNKIIFAAGIFLIAVIFLLSITGSGSSNQPEKEEKNVISQVEEYEQRLEQRLTGIINSIEGAENAKVMITLERTEESIYSDRETSVTATITPTVRGAVVICGGSESAVVRQKISDAVCKALGISAARVCVTY